jgi:hypothetical protein
MNLASGAREVRVSRRCGYRYKVSACASTLATTQGEFIPPEPPWLELRELNGPMAYVSVYLSDELARYPVRAVTKPRDNKSDPNLETGTYGLFSTCQIKMRKSIVTKGVRYILFVTTYRGHRSLAGYYRIRWFAPGPDQDYALAADSWRFVEPIKIDSLPAGMKATLNVRRGYKGLDKSEARRCLALVDSRPDWTNRYVGEIDRLEVLSARYTGFRYPTWQRKESWGWADARTYLADTSAALSEAVPNTSPTDSWICSACTRHSTNKARLKRCPECGALATLRPVTLEV